MESGGAATSFRPVRDVVVDEEERVQQLDGRREAEHVRVVVGAARELPGEQEQSGAEPLRRPRRVAARLTHGAFPARVERLAVAWREQLGEGGLDPCADLLEPLGGHRRV